MQKVDALGRALTRRREFQLQAARARREAMGCFADAAEPTGLSPRYVRYYLREGARCLRFVHWAAAKGRGDEASAARWEQIDDACRAARLRASEIT